jgi:hypothetical protein
MHATTEESWEIVLYVGPLQLPRHTVTQLLQEKVFSAGSIPRLHHEDQWDKSRSSLETAELEQ